VKLFSLRGVYFSVCQKYELLSGWGKNDFKPKQKKEKVRKKGKEGKEKGKKGKEKKEKGKVKEKRGKGRKWEKRRKNMVFGSLRKIRKTFLVKKKSYFFPRGKEYHIFSRCECI